MSDLIIAVLVVGVVPLLTLFLIKANMAVVFFAACAGLVLLDGLDPAVVSTSGALIPGPGESYIRISVVMAAILISSFLFRRSSHKLGGHLVHGLLTVLIALMLLAVLPGATGVPLLVAATDTPIWQVINDYETVIVSVGFTLSLFVSRRK